MVLLPINGIEVDFPFEPYGVQRQYMARVITALRTGHNACLESPTGTGKSLALLCATLAWRQAYMAALQLLSNGGYDEKLFKAVGLAQATPTGEQSGSSSTLNRSVADLIKGVVCPSASPVALRAPRVVFCSRTHSQLAQVINELKGTVYRPFMTVLGSRDQMCIHDIAEKLSGTKLNQACRQLTSSKRRHCEYHSAVTSTREHENRSKALLLKLKEGPPKDIEDFVSFGRQEGACPWYLSRTAVTSGEVEILFIPYNYLVDRATRDSLDIDWSNDIIIVDEAHNLENICADAVSFDLTPALRTGCRQELAKCIDRALRPGGMRIPALEELANSEDGAAKMIGSENRQALECRLLQTMLLNFEEAIAEIRIPDKASDQGHEGVRFASFPSSFLRELFIKSHGASEESTPLILEALERAADHAGAEEVADEGAVESTNAYRNRNGSGQSFLRSLHNAIKLLFDPKQKKYHDCFRTVVHVGDHNSAAPPRTVSYWCLDPAVAMSDVANLGIRSLILTSGTLSPMQSFSSELGMDFPVRLENRHVVGKDQVLGAILCAGPDGIKLSSGFRTRDSDEYKISLGRTLIDIASVVPDGVLVFFPSYRAMDSCVQFWRAVGLGELGQKPSIYELILRRKRIIVEPRESAHFAAAILAHQTNIDGSHGSILLAVCRGKVSEGIDFSDAYGRAVIIAGIPYPAAFDPKVILKREYMSNRSPKADGSVRATCENPPSGTHPTMGTAGISRDEWYSRQAVRAVNQAVGRVIRHRRDYGAVLLCDERFSAPHVQAQVSKWLRPHVHPVCGYDTTLKSLKRFFDNCSQSKFANFRNEKKNDASYATATNENANAACGRERARVASAMDSQQAADVVKFASRAIAQFVPPPKSKDTIQAEADRISGEIRASGFVSGSNGFSYQRPDTLFDVLGSRPSSSTQNLGRSKVEKSSARLFSTDDHQNFPLRAGSKRAELCSKTEAGDQGQIRAPSTDASQDQDVSSNRKRMKLSEEAKLLIGNSKGFREVLARLRTIMTLAIPLCESESSQQTQRNLRNQKNGEEEVSKLVEQIKNSCSTVTDHRVNAFLTRLQEKIPRVFQKAFVAAMNDGA